MTAAIEVVAPIVALVGAITLYAMLGKCAIGPRADFWSPLRHALFPVLERIGRRLAPDAHVYATSQQSPREYAGTVGMSVDELEVELYKHGFVKNPVAAVKTSPAGHPSESSMALRYFNQPELRRLFATIGEIPIVAGPARLIEAVFATRQLHVTLYDRRGSFGQTHVYAHEEANSVSPFVALQHYRGDTWSAERGVNTVLYRFEKWDVPYEVLDSKRPRDEQQAAEKKAQ